MTWVAPEINEGSRILIVGRDPGADEMREGRPFVGRSGRLLDACLGQAGLRRKDVSIANVVGRQPSGNDFGRHSRDDVARGVRELEDLVQRLRPNVVLALGNEAAFSLVPGWPSRDGTIFGATGIQERRGYFWDGIHGTKVVTAVHPASILRAGGESGRGASGAISRMLFIYDIQRAKEEASTPGLQRPTREVTVVDTIEKGREAIDALIQRGCCACDIEIRDNDTLLCVGFAGDSDQSFVFTETAFDQAFYLLQSGLPLVFHNGQFDTYFLRTRCGIDVQGYMDDTIVGFHCCWPELAGAGEAKSKRTEKSLRFLASLYTKDAWWKDYETDEAGMYYLNGLDCMITWDVHQEITRLRKELGIPEEIYRHEMALIDPVNRILERGILVDEVRLEASTAALSTRQEELTQRLVALAEPLLTEARDRVEKPHLFWNKTTCRSCRNGSKKRLQCDDCGGLGNWEQFEFNPNSSVQKIILLYDVLGLDTKYKDGKPSVLEEKLKDLLGGL